MKEFRKGVKEEGMKVLEYKGKGPKKEYGTIEKKTL